MPEQNSQNPQAFDPASFSLPAKSTLNYSVLANSDQTELSSYVQTVFHRSLGSKSPGATLSDQAPPAIRTAQEFQSANGDTQTYNSADHNAFAEQPFVPPIVNRNAQYQPSANQFNLNDQSSESSGEFYYPANQNQSFAPPIDRSNLPYVPRTNAPNAQQTDSGDSVLDVSSRNAQQRDDQNLDNQISNNPISNDPISNNQNSFVKESQASSNKTKLVDLRRESAKPAIPQRDQNTIAKNPGDFLKREAFSNRFALSPVGEQGLEKAESSAKIIYLKSASPAERTAKLEVPKFAQAQTPTPVAEITVTKKSVSQPALTEGLKRSIPDFVKSPPVLFRAPVENANQAPTSAEFVSTAPATVAEPPKAEQNPVASVNPFKTIEAPESPFGSSPFSSPFASKNDAEQITDASDVTQGTPATPQAPISDPFDAPPAVVANQPIEKSHVGFTDADFARAKVNTMLDVRSNRSDFNIQASKSNSNMNGSHFQVASLSPVQLNSNRKFNARNFESSDSSPVKAKTSKIILPEFKQSTSAPTEHHHLTAMTVQSVEHAGKQNDHHFEMPWLSPWWMLIGLIPFALYLGTTKLFKDEDEYRYDQDNRFDAQISFGSDFGESGKSKSDAFYGRQDETTTFPSVAQQNSNAVEAVEVVELVGETERTPAEFAESLMFELPSSGEVAQPSFPQELQIDQSPNFSKSDKPSKKRKMKSRKKARKR